jgi:hypothetical protein
MNVIERALAHFAAPTRSAYSIDDVGHFVYLSFNLSKSAKEYSIYSASLDGDEFGIVGASPTINLCYNPLSSLKLELGRSGRKSAG